MDINVFPTPEEMGAAAAKVAIEGIKAAIEEKGEAFVILATGASQFTMLENLTATDQIDWSRVTIFHLDEYIGIGMDHPASFRKYLKERVADKLPTLREFNYIDPGTDPQSCCNRMGEKISKITIDVACIGIGENGHIAFNDPPADFQLMAPYHVVDLDEICRRQQFGEGWFESLESVPKQAISMSCHEILRAKQIVCTVPDKRKAWAVANTVNQPVSETIPATILKTHECCALFLDEPAASELS